MLGTEASIWRYPVKSMQGEELAEASLGERGLAGDRAFALRDREDGKVATAKNPRKWPALFRFSAAPVETFALPPGTFFDCAPVHILTSATLARLSGSYAGGRFERPRFRPNLV